MVNFQEFSDKQLKAMLENPMTVKRAKTEIERRSKLRASEKPKKTRTRKATTTKKTEEVPVND